jgi:hypothetical protein
MSGGQITIASGLALLIALASLIMRLASTSPNVADSNLSEWLKSVGLKNPPHWLAKKEADQIAFRWARILTAIGVLAFLIFLAILWFFSGPAKMQTADQTVVGELRAANDPTPPNDCDGFPDSPNSPKVLIGRNGIIAGGPGPFGVLEINKCTAISVRTSEDGGMYLSAKLIDQDANQVVDIEDNNVKALNGETYIARMSQDGASLTIKNKKDSELFYARRINKNAVSVRGFFGCEVGKAVLIREGQPVPGFFIDHYCSHYAKIHITTH